MLLPRPSLDLQALDSLELANVMTNASRILRKRVAGDPEVVRSKGHHDDVIFFLAATEQIAGRLTGPAGECAIPCLRCDGASEVLLDLLGDALLPSAGAASPSRRTSPWPQHLDGPGTGAVAGSTLCRGDSLRHAKPVATVDNTCTILYEFDESVLEALQRPKDAVTVGQRWLALVRQATCWTSAPSLAASPARQLDGEAAWQSFARELIEFVSANHAPHQRLYFEILYPC